MAQPKKMYSAFVSSTYTSMMSERNEVINALLNQRVFPICMEHFKVSVNGNFADITDLIDQSDLFIILLGTKYGSLAANHKSITHNEYDYAVSHGLKILAIINEELNELMKSNKEEREKLDEDTRLAISFAESIPYATCISQSLKIDSIITQFLRSVDLDTCVGWLREDVKGNRLFMEEHKKLNVAGKWYHIHFSDDDPSYIRLGTFDIEQNFTIKDYTRVKVNGTNYNVRYIKETNSFRENKLRSTIWNADYLLDESGQMLGIFQAKRTYTDNFNNVVVKQGTRRGIHDFVIDTEDDGTTRLNGTFHDEAPSPKVGRIIAFRTNEERDEFINNFLLDDYLEANKEN